MLTRFHRFVQGKKKKKKKQFLLSYVAVVVLYQLDWLFQELLLVRKQQNTQLYYFICSSCWQCSKAWLVESNAFFFWSFYDYGQCDLFAVAHQCSCDSFCIAKTIASQRAKRWHTNKSIVTRRWNRYLSIKWRVRMEETRKCCC